MAIIRRSQMIRRPVEEVFRTIIEVDQFPRWNPTTPGARKLTPGEISEGTQFELEIRGFGKVLQELREFEPNRRVSSYPRSNSSRAAIALSCPHTAMERNSITNWK